MNIDEKPDFHKDTAQIIKLYCENNLSSIKIGEMYGVSHTTILDLLEKLGVKKKNKTFYLRKYVFNENYFEKIDSSDKAYFLGLLMADGCTYARQNAIEIKLKEEDGYILELFNKYLNSNKPIYFIDMSKKKYSNMRRLSLISNKMHDDLVKLGMVNKKSLILEFPSEKQMDYIYLPHFIRGYLDGDGCITIPKNNPTLASVNLCVSKVFGEVLQKILENMGITTYLCTQKKDSIYHLIIAGRKKVLRFLDWIYTDINDLFLTRKHNKYLTIKEYHFKKFNKFSSQYFGVYFVKQNQKFTACIWNGGDKIIVGTNFKNDKDAAIAYDKRLVELVGKNAITNFPIDNYSHILEKIEKDSSKMFV